MLNSSSSELRVSLGGVTINLGLQTFGFACFLGVPGFFLAFGFALACFFAGFDSFRVFLTSDCVEFTLTRCLVLTCGFAGFAHFCQGWLNSRAM